MTRTSWFCERRMLCMRLLYCSRKVKNLASKTLSLVAKQVPLDWKERYGFEPVMLETFVDVEKY